jgi:tRNA dimethylallyltransferase
VLTVVAVLGPTGVGKTRLAARLAAALGGEVLVADSRQVYRSLDIATNKPLPEETGGVPFHLTDLAEPWERFNAHLWVAAARAKIAELEAGGVLPVIEGGTGLWVDALLDGLNLAEVAPRAERRAQLEELSTTQLVALVRGLDPAAQLDFGNRRRLVRAVETLEAAGPPLAANRRRTPPDWNVVRIGLRLQLGQLDEALRQRSHRQLERGLVAETRAALETGVPADAAVLTGTGYVQAVAHLRGELSAAELPERMAVANRQLARRQLRWLRRDQRISWFEAQPDPLPAILEHVRARLS